MKTHLYTQYEQETLNKLHQVELEIMEAVSAVCDKYNLCYFAAWGTAIGVERHQGFIPWDDDVDFAMPRKDYEKFLQVCEKEFQGKYRVVTPKTEPSYCCTVTHIEKVGTKFVTSVYRGKAPYENGISIDIFQLDHLSDDPKQQKKQLKKTWYLGRLLFLVGTPFPIIPVKTPVVRQGMQAICFLTHYVLKLFRVRSTDVYCRLEKEMTRYNNKKADFMVPFTDPEAKRFRVRESEIYPLKKCKFESIEIPVISKNKTLLTRCYGDFMQMPPEEQRVNHAPEILDFGEN